MVGGRFRGGVGVVRERRPEAETHGPDAGSDGGRDEGEKLTQKEMKRNSGLEKVCDDHKVRKKDEHSEAVFM